MKFFDDAAKYINNIISDYITGEILLIGILSVILIVFLSLTTIHFFSKDIVARRNLCQVNKHLKVKKYDSDTDAFIAKKFKKTPYHFFENYNGDINAMSFSNCVPYYEASNKFGKRFFSVFSLVACLLTLITALSLTNSNLISYLSDAMLIPVCGLILALILQGIYAYIKSKAHKKLEQKFNEFIKLIKPKAAAFLSIKKLSKSIAQTMELKEEPELKEDQPETPQNFEEIMERVREVKVKGASLEKMKDLASDIAVERDKDIGIKEKDCLTEALTDLLTAINKTA